MGGFDRMLGVCAAFVFIGVSVPGVMASPPATTAAAQRAQSRAVVPLSVLHHVAQHEIELGLLAQVAAVRPETMQFATEVEKDFRVLDQRVLAVAEALGIGEHRLRQAYADQNTAALERQAAELDRLSTLRGEEFDRQFWLTVDRDQLAASDLLASASGTVSSLDPLVRDTVRLLDRSIRRAAAAETGSNTPSSR